MTTYYKALCCNCDGHIEFPPEGIGQPVKCPHCGKSTILKPGIEADDEPSQPAVTAPRYLIALIGAFVLFALVAGAWLLHAYLANREAYLASEAERKRLVELAAVDAVRPLEIRGQVYLSLAGGGSIKLAAVPVLAVQAEEAIAVIARQASSLEIAKSNLARLALERTKLTQEGQFALMAGADRERLWQSITPGRTGQKLANEENLKAMNPIIDRMNANNAQVELWNNARVLLPQEWARVDFRTVTDSDGRFTIKVTKRAAYYLAALADRLEGPSTQHYGWLVRLEPDANGEIYLNNNNRLPLPLDLDSLR